MGRGLCGRSIIHAIAGLLDKVSESKTARPPSETYQRKVYRKVLKKLIRFSSRSSCHDRYNNYVRDDGSLGCTISDNVERNLQHFERSQPQYLLSHEHRSYRQV